MTVIERVNLSRRKFMQLSAAGAFAGTALQLPCMAAAQTDGTLVIADIAEPGDLQPWMKSVSAIAQRSIYETLAEPRMILNEDDSVTIEFIPVLAESWEQPDDTTWRFKLRENVKFSNGEDFNAQAMEASFDAMGNAEEAAAAGAFDMMWALSGAEVVDDYTIDFTTTSPNNEVLGYNLRLGLVAIPPKKIADEGMDSFKDAPVGTGPYLLEDWNRGNKITLIRNPEYWDADFPGGWEKVELIFRPEAAVRAQTIASGEADFAVNIGGEQGATLPRSIVGGGFQSTSIRINNAIEPTNDQNLRLAINHAIDRAGICDAIFLGTAKPIAFFAFQPVTLEPFSFDPELATRLIQDGGWEGLELEMVYGEGRIPEEDQLAEIYKASLEAVGLVINLNKVERGRYNEIGGQEFSAQPALYMETTSSGNYAEIAGGLMDKYGTEGSGTFSALEFDARFEELASLEGDARLESLQNIAADLHELAPRAWIAGVQQVHGVSDRINPDLPLNSWPLIKDILAEG